MRLGLFNRPAAASQRGGVLVMFAVFAPVLVLMMSFVLDVGNLFALQAHLQLQADAGALAATNDFGTFPCANAVNSTITADVAKYSGSSGGTYNAQVDKGASGILESINSTTYPGPVPGTADDTNTAAPCTSGMVDVKMSDSSIPWYFRVFGTSTINAHARVQVQQETTLGPGSAPFAITDPSPQSAAACFVDEATGTILASTQLTKNGTTWSNATAPLPVTINKPRIAVRVALSGSATTSCADPAAKVYDASGTSVGILHIQGWTADGTGTLGAPIARQVVLLPGDATSCTDAYFSDPTGACTVGIQAQVDFGTAAKPAAAVVNAVVNGTTFPLTYNSTNGLVETWTTTAGKYVSIPPASGPNAVSLSGSTGTGSNKKSFTINSVQSAYTAGVNSGPITAAGVSENGAYDADSFRMCGTGYTTCTHNLVVSITIPGLTTGPLQTLSVAGNEANCGGGNAKTLIETGCAGTYAIYTGGACSTTSPITCVTTLSGVKANDIAAGLNQRILGNEKPSTCTHPNNWAMYPNLPANDPRILTVFITAYGSGNSQPIEAFATFYLTGWTGQGGGFANPCQPPPATWNGTSGGDDAAAPTTLVGHFMSYVNPAGGGGGTTCVQNSLAQCTAILTR